MLPRSQQCWGTPTHVAVQARHLALPTAHSAILLPPPCFPPPLCAFKSPLSVLSPPTVVCRCSACGNTQLPACQLQQAAQNITQLEARLSGSATSDGASYDSSSSSSGSSGLSGSAVAGIAIGCAAATAAVLSAAFFVYHRKVTRQLRQAQLTAAYEIGSITMAA